MKSRANSSRRSSTCARAAPSPSARSRASSSSLPWPRSIVTVTISARYCSASHGMATDVSSPPEYARTMRFMSAYDLFQFQTASPVPLRQRFTKPSRRLPRARPRPRRGRRAESCRRPQSSRRPRPSAPDQSTRPAPAPARGRSAAPAAGRHARSLAASDATARRSWSAAGRARPFGPGPHIGAITRALDQPYLLEITGDRGLRRVECPAPGASARRISCDTTGSWSMTSRICPCLQDFINIQVEPDTIIQAHA